MEDQSILCLMKSFCNLLFLVIAVKLYYLRIKINKYIPLYDTDLEYVFRPDSLRILAKWQFHWGWIKWKTTLRMFWRIFIWRQIFLYYITTFENDSLWMSSISYILIYFLKSKKTFDIFCSIIRCIYINYISLHQYFELKINHFGTGGD